MRALLFSPVTPLRLLLLVVLMPLPAFADPVRFVKGPYVQQVTSTSAEVRVELDQPAPLTVELEGKRDGGTAGVQVREPKTFHVVALKKSIAQ